MDVGIEIAGLIQTGDNTRLETIINENPEIVNSRTPQGISLLTLAAYCRNQHAIDLIAPRRQNTDIFEAAAIGSLPIVGRYSKDYPDRVNNYSVDGFTALGLACFFGHKEVAEFLINSGADINLQSNNNFGVSPLHSACAISSVELARLLINNGADVNARQKSGVTPLHSAAHQGNLELVKLLVANGAKTDAKNDREQTPEKLALEGGHSEVVAYFKSL